MISRNLTRILFSAAVWAACNAAQAEIVEDYKRDNSLQSIQVKTLNARRLQTTGATYNTPIDAKKSYGALSDVDRAIWRKLNYNAMPATDVPPFPKGGLRELLRPIAFKNMEDELEGEVAVHVEIDDQGVPRSVKMFAAPSEKFGEFVMAVVMQASFTPARCSGQPCVMAFPLRIELTHKTAN